MTVAQMIDTKTLYDVGCDHAYLDIYLTKEKNIKCVAIDKSVKCIKKAITNIKESNCDIKVILSDGLNNISVLPNSTVVLCGMGTRNIIKIISNKPLENLICQSNRNIYELRKHVCDLGYTIVDEQIVFEDNYYIIIKFKKGYEKYTEKQLHLGPILLTNKNKLFNEYLLYFKKSIEKNINKFDEKKKKEKLSILNMITEELD